MNLRNGFSQWRYRVEIELICELFWAFYWLCEDLTAIITDQNDQPDHN